MAEYKLELRGVCKSFPGVKALDNVQLSPSSRYRPCTDGVRTEPASPTLMKCLFGIYKMDAGEVYLDGTED